MTLSRSPSATSLFVPPSCTEPVWGRLASIPNLVNTGPSFQPDQESPSQQVFLSPPPPPDDSCHNVQIASQTPVPETCTQDSIPESQSLLTSQSQPVGTTQSRSPLTPSVVFKPEVEPVVSPPPFKSIDFAYLPKPEPLDMPVDEKWVVRLGPTALRGRSRHEAAAQWELEHWFLYRGHGNRADPPGKIPKRWGGLPKELDDALLKYEEERLSSWERRLRERGFTPTESATSSPRSPLTQEEEERKLEEYEQNRKFSEECQRRIAAGELPASSIIHKIRRNGVTYTAAEYMKLRDELDRKALADAGAQKSRLLPSVNGLPDTSALKPRLAFGMLRAHSTIYCDDNKLEDNENDKGKGKGKAENAERQSPTRSLTPPRPIPEPDIKLTDETLKRKRGFSKKRNVDNKTKGKMDGKAEDESVIRKRRKVSEDVNPGTRSLRSKTTRARSEAAKRPHSIVPSGKPARNAKEKDLTS